MAASELEILQRAEAKAAYDEQRGIVDARFTDLERRKVQGMGMACSRFRL